MATSLREPGVAQNGKPRDLVGVWAGYIEHGIFGVKMVAYHMGQGQDMPVRQQEKTWRVRRTRAFPNIHESLQVEAWEAVRLTSVRAANNASPS
jgi:hypothetical protein